MNPNGNDKISHRTVVDGLMRVKQLAVFQFEDFRISAHDASRIKATLQHLLDNAVITNQPSREKQWVTSDIIQILIQALLQDAIKNGTPSWDIVIMNVLNLLLQSIRACRSGDICRSNHYTGKECLCWKDIVIRQDISNGQEIPVATFTLAFTKGSK
ncbi:hypothetical protein EV127DRAFT_478660 [Xylaria flabelliformis]|nr:hypothetical protein EV127DRAFT_478660 [Xylaria flabelliformis]